MLFVHIDVMSVMVVLVVVVLLWVGCRLEREGSFIVIREVVVHRKKGNKKLKKKQERKGSHANKEKKRIR